MTSELYSADAMQVANDLINGNRGAARLAIRMHADPSWFVLEVLQHYQLHRADALVDLRRLLNV